MAIGLQNIVGAFYITNKIDGTTNLQNQLIVFGMFSIIINFAYGIIYNLFRLCQWMVGCFKGITLKIKLFY